MSQFKYEVAFSFRDGDRPLAEAIADSLGASVAAFVYSGQREQVTGQSGVDAYSAVFALESRTVVVLHRQGWGTTKWTRLEQTAIQTHGLEFGWDTTLLIKLDESPPPRWMPPIYIYADVGNFSTEALAAVVRNLVTRAGGTAREESITERAERAARMKQRAERRRTLLTSPEGVKAAHEEWEKLRDVFEGLVADVRRVPDAPELKYIAERDGRPIAYTTDSLRGPGASAEIYWKAPYSNTLDDSRLEIEHLKGHRARRNEIQLTAGPASTSKDHYDFDVDDTGRRGWRHIKSGRFLISEALARLHVNELLNAIEKRQRDDPIFPKRG